MYPNNCEFGSEKGQTSNLAPMPGKQNPARGNLQEKILPEKYYVMHQVCLAIKEWTRCHPRCKLALSPI